MLLSGIDEFRLAHLVRFTDVTVLDLLPKD